MGIILVDFIVLLLGATIWCIVLIEEDEEEEP